MFVTTLPAPAAAIHAPASVYPRLVNPWTGTFGSGALFEDLPEDWGEARKRVNENLTYLEARLAQVKKIPR